MRLQQRIDSRGDAVAIAVNQAVAQRLKDILAGIAQITTRRMRGGLSVQPAIRLGIDEDPACFKPARWAGRTIGIYRGSKNRQGIDIGVASP